MQETTFIRLLVALPLCLCLGAANSAELPATFPDDVPIADYMEVISVINVGDDMSLNLHAQGQTLANVANWFQSGLPAAGWTVEGEQVSAKNAILAYKKNGRRCGVTITDFVLNSSMQMDHSIKGITLQISGADVADEGSIETATEAASDMAP